MYMTEIAFDVSEAICKRLDHCSSATRCNWRFARLIARPYRAIYYSQGDQNACRSAISVLDVLTAAHIIERLNYRCVKSVNFFISR